MSISLSGNNKVFLFQGDSITDGNRDRGNDLNHILGHGYAYIIGSRLANELAEQRPVFYNRGVSGDRISDLYARWNEDVLYLQPDVLSILVGANDIWRTMMGDPGGITDRFERAYRHVLEETRERLPQAKLVLCEPFLMKVGAPAENWAEWQKLLEHYQRIVRSLAEEFHAVFVPLQAAFEAAALRTDDVYWVWDGVHPTAAGHDLIAAQWLSVVMQSGILEG
ncbi:SGNH/GDSL hydrolase family protein [Paenibacillus sp. MMS20-IR301]|uniref:SGNH/GDSL hydrolase family protein n=1 Tax=Paenibacillus sp. MMS20-IR301 TaxID=2895946 RepID=UPI0028E807E8|nr:SGNH/GDSL hydrolase family protein [Paenibacillus sp. MMS20-IR301]WNS46744.1 SGNH/GDSL hydrolase family protein [Paenibacillus sp. MMS20-IR301]